MKKYINKKTISRIMILMAIMLVFTAVLPETASAAGKKPSEKLDNVVSIFEESAGFEPNVGAAQIILALVLKVSGIGLGLVGFAIFLSIAWVFAIDVLYLSSPIFWNSIADFKDQNSGAGGAMAIVALVLPNVREYSSIINDQGDGAYADMPSMMQYLAKNMGKSILIIIFATLIISGQSFSIAAGIIRGMGKTVDAVVLADYGAIFSSWDLKPRFGEYLNGTPEGEAKETIAKRIASQADRYIDEGEGDAKITKKQIDDAINTVVKGLTITDLSKVKITVGKGAGGTPIGTSDYSIKVEESE